MFLSVCSVGVAIYSGLDISLPQIVTLLTALIASSMIGQHQPKLPNSKMQFSAKGLVVFFGILWLGMTGGVFLSLAAEIAGYWSAGKNKKRWLASVSANVLASFSAATVFYLFLNKF